MTAALAATVQVPADAHPERMAGCPKQMVYGPCGGVRRSGACEVDATAACPFVERELRPRSGRRRPPADLGTRVPRVVTDLRVTPRDAGSLRRVAAALRDSCDAVLVGDHGGARNDLAPAFMAQSLLRLGLRPRLTLACRDRNRVALGAELAARAELGVAGVHCVTGDWQGLAGSSSPPPAFGGVEGLKSADRAPIPAPPARPRGCWRCSAR